MTNPLARVVMNTVIQKTAPSSGQKTYKKESNLTHKDQDIISRLIKGEKGLEDKSIRSTPITLDEAANRIRNRR